MANYSIIGQEVQERNALALAMALPGRALKEKVGQDTARGYDFVRECCMVARRGQPRDVLLAALDLTGHSALVELFRTEKYEMTPRTDDTATGTDLEKEAMDVMLKVSALVEQFRTAAQDGRFDADESRAMLAKSSELEREVREVNDTLRRVVGAK